MGLTGYYRRFVKGYGELSRPLTKLLKKGAFVWNNEATESFEKLKEARSSTPVLELPNYTLPFTLEIDASALGVGAVLMQQGRVISHRISHTKMGLIPAKSPLCYQNRSSKSQVPS